jgi:hypothetical protein
VCVQEPTMGWTRGSKRDGGVGALQPNMVKVVAIVLLFEGLFLVAGLWGTREFFSSTYVQLGGGKIAVARGNPAHPSKKVGWTVAGYTATNLVGLVFSTFALPTAGALAAAATRFVATDALRAPPLRRAGALAAFALEFFGLAYLSYTRWEAHDVMRCGIFGCVGPHLEHGGDATGGGGGGGGSGAGLAPTPAPTIAMPKCGAVVAYGVVASLFCLAAGVVQLLLAAGLAFRSDRSNGSNGSWDLGSAPHLKLRREQRVRSGLFLALLLLPLLLFASAELPNTWEEFTRVQISDYVTVRLGQSEGVPYAAGAPKRPPEQANAWMRTIQWRLSDLPSSSTDRDDDLGFYLKLFPDVLLFYAFLWGVAATAAAAHAWPRFARVLTHRPFPAAAGAVSVGEALCGAALALLLALFTFYWAHDHNWCATWHGCGHEPAYDLDAVEDWARTLGQVGNLVSGLLILPVSRHSLWSHCLGVSWEALLWLHQLLGWAFLAIGVSHAALWYYKFDLLGYLPRDWLNAPLQFPSNGNDAAPPHGDNFTIPLAMVTFAAMLVAVGVLALPIVRRRHFEVFYYSHHIALAFFVTSLWHATGSWPFLLGGLLLWLVDGVLRVQRSAQVQATLLDARALNGDVTVLELELTAWRWEIGRCLLPRLVKKPFEYVAGQYLFLTLPSVSPWQAHPFTISRAPSDARGGVGEEGGAATRVSIHAKAVGGCGSFTALLRDGLAAAARDAAAGEVVALGDNEVSVDAAHEAAMAQALAAVPVSVEGPYGYPPPFFFGCDDDGGSGAAPIAAAGESGPAAGGAGAGAGGGRGGGGAADDGEALAAALLPARGAQQGVSCGFPVLGRHRRLLLVAGGIGITPIHAIARELYHQALRAGTTGASLSLVVHLVWTVRDKAFLDLFLDSLKEMVVDGGPSSSSSPRGGLNKVGVAGSVAFRITLHATGLQSARASDGGGGGSEEAARVARPGRPDLPAIVHDMLHYGGPVRECGKLTQWRIDPSELLVFACGPPSLIASAASAARRANAEFHSETFEF